MLKLIKCEFWKLKRKHFVSFVVFAALLFPIPFTALVLAGSVGNFTGFDAVFGLLVTLGEPVMLPIVLGIVAAMLFFMERDNDTLKNLHTIPVFPVKIASAKIAVLFILGLIYSLATLLSSMAGGLMAGSELVNIGEKIWISVVTSVLYTASTYLGSTSIWKNQERQADEITREEKVQTEHLEELLNGQEMELPGEENPLEHVAGLKQAPILNLVLPKETQVSEKQIVSEDMPENRENQTGHGTFEDVESEGGTLDSVLLGGYIQEHFADFLDEPKGGSLDYEVEYILAGRQSDRENLEAVANKLVLLRFVPNYLYLQTNSTRQAEARAAAGTLCTLLAVQAVTEAAAQGILLAWAYGESVMDVRTLLNGKKTAVVKDDASWQLSLSGLMKLGTEEDTGDGADVEGGMDYKDYVRMLLFLEHKGKLTVRTMGVIEKDMQTIYSQPSFRIDYCVGRMEVDTVCKLRRGISYRFQTYYGYQ